jgi:hypothetical protein
MRLDARCARGPAGSPAGTGIAIALLGGQDRPVGPLRSPVQPGVVMAPAIGPATRLVITTLSTKRAVAFVPRSHPLPPPEDTDVERVARQVARRLARLHERRRSHGRPASLRTPVPLRRASSDGDRAALAARRQPPALSARDSRSTYSSVRAVADRCGSSRRSTRPRARRRSSPAWASRCAPHHWLRGGATTASTTKWPTALSPAVGPLALAHIPKST